MQQATLIVTSVGMIFTLVATASALIAKLEILRQDIGSMRDELDRAVNRQQKNIDDHEARIRALERTAHP